MQPHSCKCAACKSPDSNSTKESHALMNFFLAQLDEKQQRLYVGLEAKKRGPGSERALALIFGWDEQAIAVARRELEQQAGNEPPKVTNTTNSSPEQLAKEKMLRAVPFPPITGKVTGFDRGYGNRGHYK